MQIDLNADLGEGGSHDRELLTLVSSANISCGVHAGDATSMTTAIQLAINHKVRVGAHPSFPDRENGGRKPMQLSFPSLRDHLRHQLETISKLASAHDTRLAHVKPHGALYNQAAVDRRLAEDLVMIIQEFDARLAIVGLAGGELTHAARQLNMTTLEEAFADRVYASDGTLLPRSDPRALIHDPRQAVAQSLEIVSKGFVTSVDGKRIPVQADTLCIHGDTAEALTFAKCLLQAFEDAGIRVGS
jgi:UPF0271 protein